MRYRSMMHGPAPVSSAADLDLAVLTDAVRQLRRGTALVVGDAMLDRYVYGQVNRISPEAPVPVISVERELALPGGAGNVVRCLTALGSAVAFVSVLGDDQAGSDLTGLIGGQPGVEPWLLVQGGRATTTKTRFVALGQQILRADHEQVAPIHPRLADRLIRIATDAAAATAVMVLSDYRKGVLTGDTPTRLIAAAHAGGRKVVVDPKGGDHARFAGADLIVPDADELAEATGLPVGSAAEVAAAARTLRAVHGFGAVLVIRGEEGLTLVEAGATLGTDTVRHLPSDAAELLDPAGAGDVVVAVAAAGLAAGLSMPVMAKLAALAAGIAMGKTGIAVVREDEMLEVLTPGRLAARKLVMRAQALERVERWRRRGLRVGFLAGNAAHLASEAGLALLEQARGWCDRLVVGVTGNAEGEAAAALAEFSFVDLITGVGRDGVADTIRSLRPDVLVQPGGDAAESIPGGDMLQEWGGELRIAGVNEQVA
jgi:D-beta-D-heptose 7-phosphate kinase / D-beta-D-heptose 1-phosphate adenosyltransferase